MDQGELKNWRAIEAKWSEQKMAGLFITGLYTTKDTENRQSRFSFFAEPEFESRKNQATLLMSRQCGDSHMVVQHGPPNHILPVVDRTIQSLQWFQTHPR
jgi:hypothetical protein